MGSCLRLRRKREGKLQSRLLPRAKDTLRSRPEPAEAKSPPSKPVATHFLKRWYVVLAVGFFNAILLLLVINLALYAVLKLRHPPPKAAVTFTEHFNSDKLQAAYPGWSEPDVRALLKETPREDREFEYEPWTGFRERTFQGRFVNIDPAGFRVSKNQVPWPPRPGATNVFVFGGSTAFGWYLPDDETIPSYMQECRPQAAVYNFARPAYFSSQELALFQKLLRDGHVPQVAVFVDGLNDFILSDGQPKFTTDLREFMDGKVGSNPLADLPMVRAARWMEERLQKPEASEQAGSKPNYDDPAVLNAVVERWLANKKLIEATAAAYGVRAVFVWQPIPLYKYDLRYHFFLHDDQAFGGFVRAEHGYPLVASLQAQGKLGPDVLWLADMQQDKRENLYVDSVHYTAAFSKEIAGRICEFLR
jgi:hypothetical protein